MFVFPQLRFSDASLSGMCDVSAPVTTSVVTVPSVSSAEIPVVSSAIDVAMTLLLVCAPSRLLTDDSDVPPSDFPAKLALRIVISPRGGEDACPRLKDQRFCLRRQFSIRRLERLRDLQLDFHDFCQISLKRLADWILRIPLPQVGCVFLSSYFLFRFVLIESV